MILRNIKTLLEDKYQVIPVNSSEMAIKYLALNIPDLILLDYEMPIVDGKQFMQMIREDTEFQNIPIIFLPEKRCTDGYGRDVVKAEWLPVKKHGCAETACSDR